MFDVGIGHVAVACPLVPVSTGLADEAMDGVGGIINALEPYQNDSNLAVPCIASGSASLAPSVSVNVIKNANVRFQQIFKDFREASVAKYVPAEDQWDHHCWWTYLDSKPKPTHASADKDAMRRIKWYCGNVDGSRTPKSLYNTWKRSTFNAADCDSDDPCTVGRSGAILSWGEEVISVPWNVDEGIEARRTRFRWKGIPRHTSRIKEAWRQNIFKCLANAMPGSRYFALRKIREAFSICSALRRAARITPVASERRTPVLWIGYYGSVVHPYERMKSPHPRIFDLNLKHPQIDSFVPSVIKTELEDFSAPAEDFAWAEERESFDCDDGGQSKHLYNMCDTRDFVESVNSGCDQTRYVHIDVTQLDPSLPLLEIADGQLLIGYKPPWKPSEPKRRRIGHWFFKPAPQQAYMCKNICIPSDLNLEPVLADCAVVVSRPGQSDLPDFYCSEDDPEFYNIQMAAAAVGLPYRHGHDMEFKAGKGSKPPGQHHYQYLLLEFCCAENSELGNERYESWGGKPTLRIRLHEKVDMSSPQGLKHATDILSEFPDIPVFLWGALPCTGGSPWQKLNALKSPRFAEIMSQHLELFGKLFSNFLILAKEVHRRGNGGIIFEWPTGCALWKDDRIQGLIKRFELDLVKFNGCMLGVRAANGIPIKKPWTLASNVASIIRRFQKYTCDGKHKHEPCQGSETAKTAFYPRKMTDEAHNAMVDHVRLGGSEPVEQATALAAGPRQSHQFPFQSVRTYPPERGLQEIDQKVKDSGLLHLPRNYLHEYKGEKVPRTLTSKDFQGQGDERTWTSIFSLAKEWIVDTGSGQDLSTIRGSRSDLVVVSLEDNALTQNYQTAAATTTASEMVFASIPTHDGTNSFGHQAHIYLMESSPPVLSVARRVMLQGFSHLWLRSKLPLLITPDGVGIILKVRHGVPYLIPEEVKLASSRDHVSQFARIKDLCGVAVDKSGQYCFDIALKVPDRCLDSVVGVSSRSRSRSRSQSPGRGEP